MKNNLFHKIFTGKPAARFDEPGISPAERRYRARMQAATATQSPRPINNLPDLRVGRNAWCKEVFGGIALAPEVWKRGRVQ